MLPTPSLAAPHRRRPQWPHVPAVLLAPLQPLLQRIVRKVAREQPALFARLGPHGRSRFLIDARDLPFILLLQPDPVHPRLRAVSRAAAVDCDTHISGSCRELVTMVDGRQDGDSLFFSRDLLITGNLEAAVCLRNALDDIDGSIMQHVCVALGKPGKMLWSWFCSREPLRGSECAAA